MCASFFVGGGLNWPKIIIFCKNPHMLSKKTCCPIDPEKSTFYVATNFSYNNDSNQPPLRFYQYLKCHCWIPPQEFETLWCTLQVWHILQLHPNCSQISKSLPRFRLKTQPTQAYLGQGPAPNFPDGKQSTLNPPHVTVSTPNGNLESLHYSRPHIDMIYGTPRSSAWCIINKYLPVLVPNKTSDLLDEV